MDGLTRAWLSIGVRRREPVPLAALGRPLGDAVIGLVSTGGARTRDQAPFDTGRRGDASFREIPTAVDPSELIWEHPHYDTASAVRDPDTVFPVRLLRDLCREGLIGDVAPTAASMMGYVPLTRALERETAPAIGELMQGEGVDAALLCPA